MGDQRGRKMEGMKRVVVALVMCSQVVSSLLEERESELKIVD